MNVRGAMLAGAVVLSCLLAVDFARAQQQMFLEIPGVPGEVVTPAAYGNQIEVLSQSFGLSNTGCSKTTASVSSLNFVKLTDKASVLLWAAARDHGVYATATLRFVRPDGQVYQKYEMTNVSFESGQVSGSGGELRTTESWSAIFSQMVITYTFIDGSGKPNGTQSTTIVSSNCQ